MSNLKKVFRYSSVWQGNGKIGNSFGTLLADTVAEAKGLALRAGVEANPNMVMICLDAAEVDMSFYNAHVEGLDKVALLVGLDPDNTTIDKVLVRVEGLVNAAGDAAHS